MSLTEKKIIDRLEIVNMDKIQVRECTIVERDNKEIARTFHRYVLSQNSNLYGLEQKVKDLAKTIWGNIIDEEPKLSVADQSGSVE